MFANRSSQNDNSREEAEKPFWISFADLMTALMVLFLVVMVVALINVTRQAKELDAKRQAFDAQQAAFKEQAADFDALKAVDLQNRAMDDKQQAFLHDLQIAMPKDMTLRRDGRGDVIEWGTKMQFGNDSSKLTPENEAQLRSDIQPLLKQATGTTGREVLKRFVLEGFASQRGTYLYNLNLSLERSQRVICALLDDSPSAKTRLSKRERQQVVDLFLISGNSSNAAKQSEEASRRVELRLEWQNDKIDTEFHPKLLDVGSRCALDS